MAAPRVFLSYKRNVTPDEPLALRLFEELGKDSINVFMDQHSIPVGSKWGDIIDRQLNECDYLIVFLSESSLQSEMVLEEVRRAHQLAAQQQGRPVILPVSLALKAAIPYPLGAFLNPIQWALWHGDEDTPHLLRLLADAVRTGEWKGKEAAPAGGDAPPGLRAPFPCAQLEQPDAVMQLQSRYYVGRACDRDMEQRVGEKGITVHIKGPRQMGKSSLLVRAMDQLKRSGRNVVFLDFQRMVDPASMADTNVLIKRFCHIVTRKLRLPDLVDQHWADELDLFGIRMCFSNYVMDKLLSAFDGQLVIAMDEVDRLFEGEHGEFFGTLRNWHEARATEEIWKKLDLLMVTSTDSHLVRLAKTESPFVTDPIELHDFEWDEITRLNELHGNALTPAEATQLQTLIAGHPYLTRRAFYVVASGQYSAKDMFAQRLADQGPFGEHLRSLVFRLNAAGLLSTVMETLRTQTCADQGTTYRLQAAGVMKRSGRALIPRCPLYKEYLELN